MANRHLILSVALVIVSQLLPVVGQEGVVKSAIAANQSSIDKVVTLITEMKETCIKDSEADTEAYDKYKCWCVTTEEEKKAAIEAAETKIEELNAFLEEAEAKEAELKTEIAGLEEDIAKDKDALETARANREKEHEEFETEEADMKETLSLLAEAIGVLQKVQTSFAQKKSHSTSKKTALVQVRKIVQRISPKFHSVLQKDLYDMLGALEDVEEEHLGSVFLPRSNTAALEQSWKRLRRNRDLPWIKTSEEIGKAANPNDLKGMAAGAKSYNSRSGQILGILKAMGDNIAKDLGAAQKEELNAEIAFQDLQGAKLKEIAAAEKNKKQKEEELADLLFKFSQAKRDRKRTEDQLEEDKKFLAEMLKGCEAEDKAYAKRSKIRAQEITAISETLAILTDDEARSLFDKTISLMQLSVVSGMTARVERAKTSAMKRILAAARKNKNWALASLAVQVRLDAFTKVKKAMDVMMAELAAEQKAEYEKHEECKKDLDVTEDKIKEGENVKEDLDMKHKELVKLIETLTAEITALNKEEAEMEIALKEAGETRKAENEVYQKSVADQRATIQILNMAYARMEKFYATNETSLVAIRLHAPPPPKSSKTNSYEINANSGGVLQLLSTIIADAESVEIELKLTEQNQQKNYAEFAQATTETIEADRKAIAEKTEQVSTAEGEKSETEQAQLENDASLAKLNELLVGIHTDCDWLLKYFNIRQTSRKEEMDAIQEAKAILSGADFS